MNIAEDVAAAPAVVAAGEIAEGAHAGRVVADGGLAVGLLTVNSGFGPRGERCLVLVRTFQWLRVGRPVTSGN